MAEFELDETAIRRLAALLEETGLTEIEYASGDQRIKVSKGAITAASAAAPRVSSAAAADDSAAGAPSEGHPGAVTSPMVGTVYLSPEPGATPFIKAGDQVSEGQTLLLIEAMKTYNPIRAPRAGRVVRILISDGTPVEFGEELLILE